MQKGNLRGRITSAHLSARFFPSPPPEDIPAMFAYCATAARPYRASDGLVVTWWSPKLQPDLVTFSSRDGKFVFAVA